jgi:hypothetical protein
MWDEAILDADASAVGHALLLSWCFWSLWNHCFINRLLHFVDWDPLLADCAACSWLFEWSVFHLVADLDDWTAVAVVHGEDLVVQALVFNTVWVDGVLPDGASWTNDSLGVQAVAVVVGSHAGGTVEQGSVSTFAAVLSGDASSLGSDGVTYLGTAEG